MKKVEEREKAKKEEANENATQTDVASILARRVAVEMSDSDNENATDSEYDSDDWGDESTAWHKSKLLKQKEYFFKSQESLATVIDNEDEIEEEEIEIQPQPSNSAPNTPVNTPDKTPVKTPDTPVKTPTLTVADFASDSTPKTEKENQTTEKSNTELETASKMTTNV